MAEFIDPFICLGSLPKSIARQSPSYLQGKLLSTIALPKLYRLLTHLDEDVKEFFDG